MLADLKAEEASERAAAEALASTPPPPLPSIRENVAPEKLAHEGLYLGDKADTQPSLFWQYPLPKVYVSDFPSEDRFKHTYIIGLTGAGKTSVLQHLIPQDFANGSVNKGVIVMGPDAGLFEYLSACVPPERHQDVVYFNPNRVYGEKVVGWNPLDFSDATNLPEALWKPLYHSKVDSVYRVLSRTLDVVDHKQ